MLQTLEGIQEDFNSRRTGGKKVSLADLIVLAGCAGVEKAAKNAGDNVTVPFTPGRMDASQEQTDVESVRGARADRGRLPQLPEGASTVPAEALLVDKAQLLTLTAPEMTVLVGGMRVLSTNVGSRNTACSPKRPESLTNDFFVNLLDMGTEWKADVGRQDVRRPRPQDGRGQMDRHACRSDLRLARAASRLGRGLRQRDAQKKFVDDFVAAWTKVMNLDRFDLA